ncbi:putative virion structural protein [Erwinia phage vB_EamM_Phobos]|uniref:putative virion structural protein n=1 Tax=Erwinia phage vB_EamM_Phobos TaxID=1883377 RepID=UPI00081C6DFE|nr:putative virion structural protein [Erwinia phage vB_EamM_Phobos]ANZ50427.1 putative virion structural protein [Erwinia phage vB_EamM_Phobos]
MDNWLVAHAQQYAWQRPGADGTLIIAPHKITQPTGAIGHVRDGLTDIPLPGSGWWHVYHLGKLHVREGNLNIPPGIWYKVSTVINELDGFILIYNEQGFSLPTTNAYFYRDRNGAILLGMPQTAKYPWPEKDTLFIKFYPGWNGGDLAPTIPATTTEYMTVPNLVSRQAVIDRIRDLKAQRKGYVAVWVNGELRDNLKVDDLAMWDDIEMRVDGRVRRVVDFPLKDVSSFTSTLDNKRKYLLHLPKGEKMWTFNDDLEIHVFYRNRGRYYHHHRSEAIRNLTYNDISIPTERVKDLRVSWGQITNIDEIVVRVLIRDDYMEQEALFNSDRLFDLYRLDDEEIVSAMVGVNANVVEWQAANLEQSAANRLAAAKPRNITRQLCTDAYGYNAVSHYAADTPQKLEQDSRGWFCRLPDLLARRSTVYEYDVNGQLLGSYSHNDDAFYYAVNPTCRMVEALVSEASDAMDVINNASDFQREGGVNYSFYLQKLKSGLPTGEYLTAVKDTDYTETDGYIEWKVDRTRRSPTVISDKKHLFITETFVVEEGEIRLGVMSRDETGQVKPLFVPMETVEVWLNKHPIVHGIDFTVQWPTITVVNKVFINDGEVNEVCVRARGVTGALRVPENGFVTSGVLSNNSRYDVREDKVIRIVAGGRLVHRSDVVFREDSAVGVASVPDGVPYSVDDPTIPLRTLVEGNSYDLRDKARDLDERIEDYLSVWFPTPPPAAVVPLPSWYHLYSPVLNKVMWDILRGRLTVVEDDVEKRISTTQLDEIMEGYKDLLVFDPAYYGFDRRFVRVHPHLRYVVVDVPELTFALLDRINARYLNNAVTLNQYLKIKG